MANNNKKVWHEEITNYIRRYYGVLFWARHYRSYVVEWRRGLHILARRVNLLHGRLQSWP